MTTNLLEQLELAVRQSASKPDVPVGVVTFRTVTSRMPREGLAFSLCVHVIAGALLWMIGSAPRVIYKTPLQLEKVSLDRSNIVYLPALGGGTEGGGRSGGGAGKTPAATFEFPARSSKGFAYPGPQPLVSNPPNAVISIQTILQPSLDHLPRVKRLIELPNIVQPPTPAAPPEAKQAPIIVKGGRLSIPPPPEKTVAAPKVTLPERSSENIAELMASKLQLPKANPDPVEAPTELTFGSRENGLLVLNAVPPPPDVHAIVPRGEARSLFAISPAEVTTIAAPSAGTNVGASTGEPAGNGKAKDASSGDALESHSSGGNSTIPYPGASGSGTGGQRGDGEGLGINNVAAGAGSARGSGLGTSVGSGSATGRGTGGGAGSAPGTGGFPGITIQGGRYGNSANMLAKAEPRSRLSYNMTIFSTAGSGGGLPDYGVFRDEKVYTVYIDMSSDGEDRSMPSWTLQYAVLQAQDNPAGVAGRIEGTPTPPYVMLKAVPQFAPELLHKNTRNMVVASAILNTAGKLEDLSVERASESALIAPLLEALRNWVFEPAKINGQPIALRVLLGMRLSFTR